MDEYLLAETQGAVRVLTPEPSGDTGGRVYRGTRAHDRRPERGARTMPRCR